MKDILPRLLSMGKHLPAVICLALGCYMLIRTGANLFETAFWHSDAGYELRDMRSYVVDGNWLQMGRPSSTGSFRVPPFFLLLMMPSAWLTNWTVYGPIVWTALLGALTIPLVYMTVRELTNSRAAGLVAGYVFASSALLTPMFRSLWSIYPAWPFLALLLYAGIRQSKNSRRDTILFAVATATAASFHPFLFYLFPLGIGWFLWRLRGRKAKRKLATLYFGILTTIHLPVMVHEIRTGFANFRGFLTDFSTIKVTSATASSPLSRVAEWLSYSSDYLLPPSAPVWIVAWLPWFWCVVYIGCLFFLVRLLGEEKQRDRALWILLVFVLGFVQLLFYQGLFEPRYWIPLWLLPPLALGIFVTQMRGILSRWPVYSPVFVTVAVLMLSFHFGLNHLYSWQTYVARSGIGRPYAMNYYGDVSHIINWMAAEHPGEPFNFYNNILPFSQMDFIYLFERRGIPFSPDADNLYVLDDEVKESYYTPYKHCLREEDLVLSYFEYRLYNFSASACKP